MKMHLVSTRSQSSVDPEHQATGQQGGGRAHTHTHPTSAAVFGGGDVLGDWVSFVQADGHRVADRHVCGPKQG